MFTDHLLNMVNGIYMFISVTSQNCPKIPIKNDKNGRGEDDKFLEDREKRISRFN